MPLPEPESRRPVHTRRIAFEGFLRDDGLWDIDCELVDTKAEPIPMEEKGTLQPGEPVHHMRVRLTLDDQMTIQRVQSVGDATPFGECQNATGDPMQKLVGLTIGPGWRRMIDGAIGGTGGCTHMRELVFNAATAAFQMIPGYKARMAGAPRDLGDKPPFYMGKCMAWSFEGPVVMRFAPRFYRGKGAASNG